jgi:hypothetical protein
MDSYIKKNEIKDKTKDELERINGLKGADDFFAHFASLRKEKITKEDVEEYFAKKKGDHTDIERRIVAYLKYIKDPPEDSTKEARVEQGRQFNLFVEYLQARNEILTDTREKIGEIEPEDPELPLGLDPAWNSTKDAFGAAVEGFQDATGRQKVTMLAGAFAALMLLRTIWKGNGKDNKFKKGVRWIIGGTVTAAAFHAMNKAVEQSRGQPLISTAPKGGWRLPNWMPTEGEWDATKHRKRLDAVWKDLRSSNMPVENFSDFVTDGSPQRYAFAIANISTLTVDEMKVLYESNKAKPQIADSDSNYPSNPFSRDFLTPIERFSLVEEICHDLGLIDDGKNWINQEENMQKASMLYFVLAKKK